MQNSKLKTTHKKLTILFTGVVFGVVLILGLSTLGAKYLNDIRVGQNNFTGSSQEIIKMIENDDNFLQNFFMKQSLEEQKPFPKFRDDLGKNNRFSTSFFILNENQEIIFQNILETPDFQTLSLDTKDDVFQNEGYFFRVSDLKNTSVGNTVVFFKKLPFDSEYIMRDTGILFFITLLFGVLFYVIGYRFVGRALVPVSENLQDMADFIHNAGHELKTPLAVMRGNLQVMQAEKKLDPLLLKESIAEVDHMNGLIESLRELSELGVLSEKKSLSLSEELENINREFLGMIQEKHIEFLGLVLPDYKIYANPQELHVLLANIIKNAIRYTPEFGKIKIKLQKNKLTISDTGIGISKEEQEKIFERFYQGNTARSNEGYGIGLSLVKKIADANGWKIQLKSELGKGTDVTIIF